MGSSGSSAPSERESERLYRRPDSRFWWCTYTDSDGKRVRESTGETSKKDARHYLEEREAEVRDPLFKQQSTATLRAALKSLVDDREARAESATKSRSMATATFYLAKSKMLLTNLGREIRLNQITPALLDQYVTARRAAGVKDTTIHKEITTLRAALKIARRAGLWTGDLDALIPEISGQSTPKQRWLTERELVLVLDDLVTSKAADRAARVAFVVATSAEWAATERAQRSDISADSHFVHVRGSKRDTRDRVVPIARPWQEDLLAIARLHAQGKDVLMFKPWLHSNSIRDLGLCAERVKIERFSWNDLRRTCAQWLRRDGVALELVSAVLGHADTRMVARVYGRLDAAELRRQITRGALP
ncbi:MAG: tyrosine-type recombinase/integrase [Polyangiales bacterium]